MVNPSDLAARAAIDDKIAKEIADHKERLRALNSQRNTYCAINKVPDEVLLRILSYAKPAPAAWPRIFLSPSEPWLTPTHVCQTWRNLMLDCPHFWTHIDSSSSHARRMLTLAKGAPLQVTLRAPRETDEHFWTFAEDIMVKVPQIRSLTVFLEHLSHLSYLYSLSSIKSARMLESFTLLAVEFEDIDEHAVVKEWLEMPSLLSLSLRAISWLPEVFIAPRLTHLHMDSSTPISFRWALSIIQNSPLLEILYMEGLGAEPAHFETSPVYLPNLRLMTFSSSYFNATNIFKHIRLPVTAALEWSSSDETDFRSADLAALEAMFSRFTPNYSSSLLERISINMTSLFQIIVPRPDGKHWQQNSVFDSLPLVYLSAPRSVRTPVALYDPLCLALPLSYTRILELRGVRGYDSISLASSIIHASIHIKTLELKDCDFPLLDCLLTLPGAELPVNSELECLVFKDSSYDAEIPGHQLLTILIQVLCERRNLGIPIRTLKGLCGGVVPIRTMKILKILVDVVECGHD